MYKKIADHCVGLGCPAPFLKVVSPVIGEVSPLGDRGSLHDAAIDRPKACIDARPKAGKADSDRLVPSRSSLDKVLH